MGSLPSQSAAAFPALLAIWGRATRNRGEIAVLRPRYLARSPASMATDRDGARKISRLATIPFVVEDMTVRIGCRQGFDQLAWRHRPVDAAAVEKAPDGPGLAPADKVPA